VVAVDVDGVGFYEFLIDSGSSGILVTADLRSKLGVSPTSGRFMNGDERRKHSFNTFVIMLWLSALT
jgi:hypothetical protein